MTESEWLTTDDVVVMLGRVLSTVSYRKVRLFSTNCCRHIWRLLVDNRSRRAVEAADRYADELASASELASAYSDARAVCEEAGQAKYKEEFQTYPYTNRMTLVRAQLYAAKAALVAVSPLAKEPYQLFEFPKKSPVRRLSEDEGASGWSRFAAAAEAEFLSFTPISEQRDVFEVAHEIWGQAKYSAECQEMAFQVALLHDIIGNPFRPATVNNHILSWNNGTVLKLAQAIYAEQTFERMSILADALEDAGCNNANILDHCRENRTHWRGCWVVELIMEKQRGS